MGSTLLGLVVEPLPGRSRAKVVELNVHKGNELALAWYRRRGFEKPDGAEGEAPGGLAYVMRWSVQ